METQEGPACGLLKAFALGARVTHAPCTPIVRTIRMARCRLLTELGVKLDSRGNVAADTVGYASSRAKVFACGDMRRGQSLVVWAIREGRQCASAIDRALMGATTLPR